MSISLLASVSSSAEWVRLRLTRTHHRPDCDHSYRPWHMEGSGVAVLSQEDDEAVSKHGHPHQEVGQGQPVTSPSDPSLPAVVAVEEHGVLQVTLPRERPASPPTLASGTSPPVQPSLETRARPSLSLTPRDQTVSRSCAAATCSLGMVLLAVLPKGWPAMSW